MHRLVPLFALLAVVACDTRADGDPGGLVDLRMEDLSHDADALVGTWDLVSTTSSGYAGPPTTTPYTGPRQGYTFRADGTAEYRDASGAIRAEPYAVVPPPPGYPDAVPSLRIGEASESWGIDGDRFYTDSRSLDGTLFEYLRR